MDFRLITRIVRRVAIFGVSTFSFFFLTGCISTPDNKADQVELGEPEAWVSLGPEGAFRPQAWMEDFNDRQLLAILEESAARNYNLEAAAARLEASIAGTFVSRAGFWPTLTGGGNVNESRRNAASGIQQTPVNKTYGLSARFNWEIDLWGKLRNGYRGDLADAEAAMADYEATRLSIAGRTAKAWYSAIEAEQQLALAKRTLDAFNSSQQIVEENFERGIGRALDVRLVRANLAGAESTYEQRLRARSAAARNLEVLLGRYPSNELEIAMEWPEISAGIPAGLPGELLLRRPDVLAAERRLAAAEQRKYEAKKALLPSIALTLNRGTSAADVDGAFELMDRRTWSKVFNISQPLFQGKRLKASSRRARANYEAAVASFGNTALVAFQEVENALTEQSSYERDFELQKIASEESIAAEELAWEQYGRGLADITTALDAVRRSLAAQRSLIQVTNQRIQSRVDLYLALGGGFEVESPEASDE